MTEYGEFYGIHYYEEIKGTERKIDDDISHLIEETSESDDLKPIVYYTHRIKSPSSLKEKLKKRGQEPTYESALDNGIHDIIGFRIICAFIDDVRNVAEFFENNDDYEVTEVKDYIAHPKPNGYRSLHMILRMTKGDIAGTFAEIQIRTIAMDTWGTLEHKLKYKKNIGNEAETEAITKELKKCAEMIASIDIDMSAIKNMLGRM